MPIDKQKEIIELRKLYLTQFEKFETKVLLSFIAIVLLPLFIFWIQGKLSDWIILILFLIIIVLDTFIEVWRKNNFNKLIKEINSNNVGEI